MIIEIIMMNVVIKKWIKYSPQFLLSLFFPPLLAIFSRLGMMMIMTIMITTINDDDDDGKKNDDAKGDDEDKGDAHH